MSLIEEFQANIVDLCAVKYFCTEKSLTYIYKHPYVVPFYELIINNVFTVVRVWVLQTIE